MESKEVKPESKSLHTKGELKYDISDTLYIFSPKEPVATLSNYSNYAEMVANGERMVKAWNAHDELVKVLDMVTRVFIYHSKGEFNAEDKIKATEMAVKALRNVGITTIGQTFEK